MKKKNYPALENKTSSEQAQEKLNTLHSARNVISRQNHQLN